MRKNPPTTVAKTRGRKDGAKPLHQDAGEAGSTTCGSRMTPSASNCARSATQTRSGGLTSGGMRFAAKAIAEKPAKSSRQELQASRCARASRDSGLVKSSPNTASKSSHCILGLRTEEPWGGPCLEYNQSFDACCGPRSCFHSSLFLRTWLCFCGLTFLASLFAHFFLKQLAQTG